MKREVVLQELLDLLSRHGDLTSAELLAIAANMIGKMIALQDRRTMTSERALRIVSDNIKIGNYEARQLLAASKGSA